MKNSSESLGEIDLIELGYKILSILFSLKKPLYYFFIFSIIIGFISTAFIQPKFEANTRILFKLPNENLKNEKNIDFSSLSTSAIRTEIEIMLSNAISHQVKKEEEKEVWISAEKNKGIEDLREMINTQLFNGIYRGWISLEPSLGNIRAKLFRMGCVDEEKVSDTGKIYTYIHIGQDELKSFIDIEGFALCEDKDIILES